MKNLKSNSFLLRNIKKTVFEETGGDVKISSFLNFNNRMQKRPKLSQISTT
jgi:hypothetical protein